VTIFSFDGGQKKKLPRGALGKKVFCRELYVADGNMLFCREQLTAKMHFSVSIFLAHGEN
jgi:hypothetical protein